MTVLRTRPARVLPFHGDRLAADAGRAVLDEWAAHIAGDSTSDGRAATLDRMAALTDYYAQRAALEVLTMTGWTVPAWNIGANRADLRHALDQATTETASELQESALTIVMREARRPFTEYEMKRRLGK